MNEIDYHVKMFTLDTIDILIHDEASEEEIMHGLMLLDNT
jgi:hypothetical protein